MAKEGQSMPHLQQETSILPIFSVPVPEFPQEIINEILSWLPVKSLLRFKCVSKSWLSLISSSTFIKAHLKNSSKQNKYDLHRLAIILSEDLVKHTILTFSLHSLLYDISSVTPLEQLAFAEDPFIFVGSCNGLICLVIIPGIPMLLNLFTNKSRTLPFSYTTLEPLYAGSDTTLERPSLRYLTDQSYAFGYDEFNDDYKFVIIYGRKNYFDQESALGVYSLRTDSWKLIEGIRNGFGFSVNHILVNGALHWRSYEDGLRNSPVIISFNLEKEAYGKIAVPDDLNGDFDWSLVVVEGSLCVLCKYNDGGMDIWIMKEYGVLESWTKVASILNSENLKHHVFPWFVSAKGKLLLRSYKNLAVYDTKNDVIIYDYEIIQDDYENIQDDYEIIPKAFLYTESLVSP